MVCVCPHDTRRWPFLMRKVTAGHEIESEVGLCIDHSDGSRCRKWGCLFSNWLRSLLELWIFVSPNFYWSLHFPFAHQRKSVAGYFVVLTVMPEFEKRSGLSKTGMHVFSSTFVTAQPFCRLQRRATSQLRIRSGYVNDLISWILLRVARWGWSCMALLVLISLLLTLSKEGLL